MTPRCPHHCLDLQYDLDSREQNRIDFEEFQADREPQPLPETDFERAQLVELLAAGEHDQWADWAQSILDSEPGLSNGRKAAWPKMIATPYKNLSEDLKEKDRREVYLRSSVALAEIERLRADAEQYERVIEARLNVIDQLQVENRELQESLTAAYLLGSHKKEQEMATMVKKLEDALVEERARGNHYGMSYEEAMFPDPIERWIINGEIDAPKIYIDRVRDAARDQLVAEGKIGDGDQFSDTAKMGWQVTKERKNALRFSISGEMSPTCSCKYCKDAIATIRFMLTEAGI